MSQNLLTFEKALKDNYLPAWRNQLGIEPTALLSKVKKVPLTTGAKIKATAPIGLSGGFGYGVEGGATPASGNVPFVGFETTAKDMYCNIVISNKVVKLTGSAGAMANALDVEVKGAYDTSKWNVGRSLFGNGTGILTTSSAVAVAANVVTVASVLNVKEGLIIDFYETGAAVGSTPAVAARRITAIDRTTKTVTFSGAATTLDAGFITVQNSYGREITGVGAIFDTGVTSLYGLTKADNAFLTPTTVDAENDIDEEFITQALRNAKNYKNSNVDMLLCGDGAYDAYTKYLRINNIRNEKTDLTLTGGFKAIAFVFGNRVVEVVNESFVPNDEIWGVETGCLEYHTMEWDFAELQGGGIFNLMENQSAYRALLANYGDLICTNPGGCLRITNCTA